MPFKLWKNPDILEFVIQDGITYCNIIKTTDENEGI